VSAYLLDTNILISLINQTEDKLPIRIRELLKHSDFQPSVSVVSPWEMSIKMAAGKLQVNVLAREIGEYVVGFGDYRSRAGGGTPRTRNEGSV
jgi:PIN domain nuclease of toxin-antitoxin system